jgi:hypothetical protein
MSPKKPSAKKPAPGRGKTEQDLVNVFSPLDYPLISATVQQSPEMRRLGRRSAVPDNIFWGRLNDLAYLFEENWPFIGWRLQCIRSHGRHSPPDEIRDALQPLHSKYHGDRVAFLLRPTSVAATSDEVRRTLLRLGEARTKLRALEDAYKRQLEEFNDARRAVRDASLRHSQELKQEITRRISNRVKLKKEYATKENSLTVAQREFDKAGSRYREAAKIELSNRHFDFKKCKEELESEERIIFGLKERLALATKPNWLVAREEKKKRLKALKETKAKRKSQYAEADELDRLYQDQAAGFARNDILRFFAERRAHHHPRQVARAIAGLPEMGCRDSFRKSEKFPFEGQPHINFQVFEVIDKACTNRKPRNPLPLLQLVDQQIKRVPKTIPYCERRVPNYLLRFLQENRRHLEEAIRMCESGKQQPQPGELPYIVTVRFLENIATPKTDLERILSQNAMV